MVDLAFPRRLNIFWRIMAGYLLVILILMLIVAYSLVNLNRMTGIINVLIYSDQQAVDLERQMADSFLSRVRNFRKYRVTGDDAFLGLSRAGRAEFLDGYGRLIPKLRSAEERELAGRILASFQDFEGILTSADAGSGEPATEGVTGDLDSLVDLQQKRIGEQIQGLKALGTRAVRIVQVLLVISLFSAALIALLVTKGIHGPLRAIQKMTTVVAAGDFDRHIELDSPPELAELARSFNQMSDRLKQLDEMKSGFISHVSHELRTPLASIKEADSLLLEDAGGTTTPQQRRFLTIIEQGANKLMKMIDDLLDLSKMEAGMMKYDLMPADIRPILAHALDEVELLAGKKGLRLSSRAGDPLPRVPMDINKIQQVVVNLLSNAIKFTPEGGRIEVMADAESGHLRVRITDSGIGIPPEFQARIFDRFLDIIPEGIPGTKGTGLGLSIARHIVQAHGGRIWVESAPGKGSAFTFVLPPEKELEAGTGPD